MVSQMIIWDCVLVWWFSSECLVVKTIKWVKAIMINNKIANNEPNRISVFAWINKTRLQVHKLGNCVGRMQK